MLFITFGNSKSKIFGCFDKRYVSSHEMFCENLNRDDILLFNRDHIPKAKNFSGNGKTFQVAISIFSVTKIVVSFMIA